jgi:hypothetical protein
VLGHVQLNNSVQPLNQSSFVSEAFTDPQQGFLPNFCSYMKLDTPESFKYDRLFAFEAL